MRRSLIDELTWFTLKNKLDEAYGFRADKLSEEYARLMAKGKVKEAKALEAKHKAAVRKETADLEKSRNVPADPSTN